MKFSYPKVIIERRLRIELEPVPSQARTYKVDMGIDIDSSNRPVAVEIINMKHQLGPEFKDWKPSGHGYHYDGKVDAFSLRLNAAGESPDTVQVTGCISLYDNRIVAIEATLPR